MLVADIVVGNPDMRGEMVQEIFAKVSQKYCVYRTNHRVMVHFADEDALGMQQREATTALEPMRADTDAEFEGWLGALWWPAWLGERGRTRDRIDGLRRRIAQALVAALGGAAEQGRAQLSAILAELKAERVSIGRVEYLLMGFGAAAAMLAAAWAMTRLFGGAAPIGTEKVTLAAFVGSGGLIFAVGFAALGALFSISLQIRDRKIQTDESRRDNLVDAGLRVSIAGLSAIVLFALLYSGLVGMQFNGSQLDVDFGGGGWVALIIAFLAGFSERLVSSFLGAAETKIAQAGSLAGSGDRSGADENNPGSGGNGGGGPARSSPGSAGAVAPAIAAVAMTADDLDEEHGHAVDGCLCDHQVADDDLTDDVHLPAAYGGVEGERI